MKPEELLALVKNHRRMWVEVGFGDMPPTVMTIRDGQVVATVTAPQIDKMLGVKAAALCRDGLSADALLLVLDAHIREEAIPEGVPEEEAERLWRERFPPGSMQRLCDQEGACEVGPHGEPPLLSDALVCQFHSADDHWMKSLLYKYDSSQAKSGIEWTTVKHHPKGSVGGNIFDNMRRIFEIPKGIDNESVRVLMRALKLTPLDTYQRLGRAAIRALANLKYVVFVDKDHPELIPAGCESQEFGLPKWYNE